MEQNNHSIKLMEKKILIIALGLSIFLLFIAGICAININSRPSTYGILFGLVFSWFSLIVIWFFFIYNWKGRKSITILAGALIWIIRTIFLLTPLLIIIFVILNNLKVSNETSYALQILLCTLFAYLIPMFTVFLFWIEEKFINRKNKKIPPKS